MWWSRRGFFAAALALGGCGFRPLYGERVGGEAVRAELAAVDLGAIEAAPLDRHVAQILKRALARGGVGSPVAPRYRLEIALGRTVEPLAISSDDTVTRYNVQLRSAVRLVRLADGAIAYTATVRSVGSYDVQESDFGTVVALDDTSGDAARDMGERIITLLAAFFARQASAP